MPFAIHDIPLIWAARCQVEERILMAADTSKDKRTTISDLVIGLFVQGKCFRDAVADLAQAGFRRNEIRAAFPIEGQRYLTPRSATRNTNVKHSFIWRLRQSFEHDLHRRGRDQLSGTPEDSSFSEVKLLYSEVPLRDTLRALGVAEDRIVLLNNEMGADGALLLVDAGSRRMDVESILQRNAGIIRTDTATEHPPSAA
jgi:hypothetical protein